MEIGGMHWEIATPDELHEGQALRMTSVDDFSRGPDYPMADRTTIIKDEEGTVQIILTSERNDSYYQGTGEFAVGALRAIIDYVEPSGAAVEQPVQSQPSQRMFGNQIRGAIKTLKQFRDRGGQAKVSSR